MPMTAAGGTGCIIGCIIGCIGGCIDGRICGRMPGLGLRGGRGPPKRPPEGRGLECPDMLMS